ncbi:MAG: hypothetical protein LBM41_07475 [Ruminococcus sp.]|jgi:hypothetical protein|nr:hypothetical protein [Ruminococcus sp.]
MEAFFIIVLIVCVIILFVRSANDRAEIKKIKDSLKSPEKAEITAPVTPVMPVMPGSYAPPPAVQAPKPHPQIAEPKEKIPGFEKKIGQRLFGILAAVMIFGGLIYLAVQYYEYITDAMKIAFMFAASAAVTLFGYVRSRRDKNSFTLAVTACGEGMFVVSILLSKFYFHIYNDYAVFAALALWFVACLFTAKNLKTNTLIFLSILDIFIAICFAIGLARITDILPVVILQIVISALVLALSYVMCKKSFAFGLLCSMATSFFTLFILIDRDKYIIEPLILLTFVIICSVLLVFAVEKLYKESETKRVISTSIGAFIFAISFIGVIIRITDLLTRDDNSRTGFIIPVAAIAFGFAAIYALENFRKKGKIHLFTAVSFGIASAVSIIMMNFLYLEVMPVNIPIFIPTAFAFIAIYAYGKNSAYAVLSCCMAFIAAFDMMITRFSDLADFLYYRAETQTVYIALSLLIFAIIFFIPFLQYKLLSDEHKSGFLMPLRVIFILLSEITLFVLFAIPWWFAERYEILAIILPLFALALWYFCTRRDTKISGFLTFNEYAVLTCCTIILGQGSFPVLSFLIFLSVSALAAYRGKRLLEHKMLSVGSVFFVIKWYGIIIAAMSGFDIENAFIYSLVLMAAGALFIVGGYRFNLKSLRIMGLITAIICTLKIALIDVPASNSSLRVVAMIFGGVICFGISAVYAYFDKRFTVVNNEQKELGSDETTGS